MIGLLVAGLAKVAEFVFKRWIDRPAPTMPKPLPPSGRVRRKKVPQ